MKYDFSNAFSKSLFLMCAKIDIFLEKQCFWFIYYILQCFIDTYTYSLSKVVFVYRNDKYGIFIRIGLLYFAQFVLDIDEFSWVEFAKEAWFLQTRWLSSEKSVEKSNKSPCLCAPIAKQSPLPEL